MILIQPSKHLQSFTWTKPPTSHLHQAAYCFFFGFGYSCVLFGGLLISPRLVSSKVEDLRDQMMLKGIPVHYPASEACFGEDCRFAMCLLYVCIVFRRFLGGFLRKTRGVYSVSVVVLCVFFFCILAVKICRVLIFANCFMIFITWPWVKNPSYLGKKKFAQFGKVTNTKSPFKPQNLKNPKA